MEATSDNEANKKIEERKEKIKNWLSEKENIFLVLILIFGIGIRLYYYLLTIGQALWWDEAAYGTLAKNYIFHTWDGTSAVTGENVIRPPLFPFLWSLLLRAGFNEAAVRFVLEFIPSVISIFLIYLIGKEMYDKKVGLISALILSVFWIHLFYTGRLLTEVPLLLPLLGGVYYFAKANKDEFNYTYFFISLLLVSTATLIKYTNGIFLFIYFTMLLINKRYVLVKNKKFWIYGISGITPILIFFLKNYIFVGNIFPAFFGDYLSSGVGGGTSEPRPIHFGALNLIPVLMQPTFFIFFLLGLAVVTFQLFIGYNYISKNRRLSNHLLLLLIMIFVLSFFIFYNRASEDRWLFPIIVSMCTFAGVGLSSLNNFFKKYNKTLAFFAVVVILLFGAYGQIKFADSLIKNRAQSFLQMRQGFEWVRDNTPRDSVIAGDGTEVYAIYYAERKYLRGVDLLDKGDSMADYLVVHGFTPQEKISPYLQNQTNQEKWTPIQAFFIDAEQKQPIFIIYKKNTITDYIREPQ